jgi:hypothetical protein
MVENIAIVDLSVWLLLQLRFEIFWVVKLHISAALWHHVLWYVGTIVMEEHTVTTFWFPTWLLSFITHTTTIFSIKVDITELHVFLWVSKIFINCWYCLVFLKCSHEYVNETEHSTKASLP